MATGKPRVVDLPFCRRQWCASRVVVFACDRNPMIFWLSLLLSLLQLLLLLLLLLLNGTKTMEGVSWREKVMFAKSFFVAPKLFRY